MRPTYQSEVAQMQRVMLVPASSAFRSQRFLASSWQSLHYAFCPDYHAACREYDAFQGLLESYGITAIVATGESQDTADSIYVRDASILTDEGAILCRMGKVARRGEPETLRHVYHAAGIPILGQIEAPGWIEGGDTAWIDATTLAVARGYRTNDAGIRQLRQMAAGRFDVVEVDLPHYRGPTDVFHLMSIFSPVDQDLGVVYSPLMPVRFRQFLLHRGYTLVEVAEQEFETLACNVLAIAPRHCLMTFGNPQTAERLRAAGATVIEYEGKHISAAGMGGPTCLTRPLERLVHDPPPPSAE